MLDAMTMKVTWETKKIILSEKNSENNIKLSMFDKFG